jgi:hypothetical protein
MVVLAAVSAWLIIPAVEVGWSERSLWEKGGAIHLVPFWPRYWRRLRGIPEPSNRVEASRSDDGGLLIAGGCLLVLAAAIAGYRWYRRRNLD